MHTSSNSADSGGGAGWPLGSQLHHAKSYRPVECFANENCKLRNELTPMWCLREVQLKIPQRDPLSAERNDASTWRIGVSLLTSLMTNVHNDSLCCTKRNKMSSRRCPGVMSCTRYITQAFSLTSSSLSCGTKECQFRESIMNVSPIWEHSLLHHIWGIVPLGLVLLHQ